MIDLRSRSIQETTKYDSHQNLKSFSPETIEIENTMLFLHEPVRFYV